MAHRLSHSSHPHSRSPAHQGRSIESYKNFILSHLDRHPSLKLYYQPLLDFLSRSSNKRDLQVLRTIDISEEFSSQEPQRPIWTETRLDTVQNHPRITCVEGFPSPENIAEAGIYYNAQPELFLSNLGTDIRDQYLVEQPSLNNVQPTMEFFEVPQLPSSLTNVVSVRLVTLCRASHDRVPTIPTPAERLKVEKSTEDFQRQLFQGKRYGSTRFRTVNMHNGQHFSVEQMVSMWVTKTNGMPWKGLLMLDKGRGLKGLYGLPWSSYGSDSQQAPLMIPVISSSVPTSLTRLPSAGEDQTSVDQLHPYNALQDVYACSAEELQLLRDNPFILLGRLLSTAAHSWSQFLNHLSRDINYCLDATTDDLYLALGQLRYNASLLARMEGFLVDNKNLIAQQGSALWPRSNGESSANIKELQCTLDKDHDFLLRTCAQLSARCERYQDILVSAAQMLDAQKGVEQAKRGHKLTRLAFIFVPLAFVASLFGMNIDILDDNPPWWYYPAIALPLTFASWIISDWRDLALHDRWTRCVQRCQQWLRTLHC